MASGRKTVFSKKQLYKREINGSPKTRKYFQWTEKKVNANPELNTQKNIFQK